MASRNPSFFKFFMPDLSSLRLVIPRRFLKHLGGASPSRTATVIGPSGRQWRVNLGTDGRDVAFKKGWREFVADHSVEAGDFLVFEYDGDLVFRVLVFDKTACEKEAAFTAKPFGDASVERSGRKRKRRNDSIEASSMEKCRRSARLSDKCKPKEPEATKEVVAFSGVQSVHRQNGDIISQRRAVTEDEMAQAIERARSFKSMNPFTTVVMKENYVYKCFFLHLPKSFAMNHLPKCKTEMILWDPNGKSWTIRYLFYGHCAHLSGGWREFSQKNNLEKNDVCIFELLSMKEMRVHIFRVVQEITPFIKNNRKLRDNSH